MSVTASIIVSTYNRSRFLKRLLLSLSSQTMAPDQYEVLVFDDGSTDETAETCREMMRKSPNMKYMSTGINLGIAKAQNMAIRESRGKHLLFVDDDCITDREWAEKMNSALEREPIVAGSVATTLSSFIVICHNIAQFYPFMPGRAAGNVDSIAGANMGFRRSLLDDLGAFDERILCGPDMEMILRARAKGYSIYFEPEAVVTHDPMRTSLVEILQYSSIHAASTILLRYQYRELLRTPFVLRYPALLLAASPLIALKVTSGIYLGNRKLMRHIMTFPVVFALKLSWCWGAARSLRSWKKAGKKA